MLRPAQLVVAAMSLVAVGLAAGGSGRVRQVAHDMARRLLHRPSWSAPTAADRSFGTGPPHPELVALDLASGAVRFRRPADPPGIDPRAHNQRSALVLANGRVSVASGGRFGDCSRYQGWEWAASRRDGPVVSFRVPTAAERVFRRRLDRSSTGEANCWSPP